MIGVTWLRAALVAGVCLGSLALNENAAAAPTLDPTPATVIAGQSITLTLNDTISGSDSIAGVDLVLTYDHSLLTLLSVANGSLLVGWDSPYFNPSNGGIAIAEDNGDYPDGTGSVLQLTFAATVTDPTGLTLVTLKNTPDSAGAPYEYQLASLTKSINITAASVTPPTTVPEPGTVALLLAPLLAVTGLTRRNRC